MKRIDSNLKRNQANRRGIAILWLIIWGSMFMTFFGVVLEIATLWQAQVELNNALDAGALAAVKEWEAKRSLVIPDNSTLVPRQVGLAYLEANLTASPVQESSAALVTNYNAANSPNENSSCAGTFVFGNLTSTSPPDSFNAGATGGLLAVRTQASAPVKGFWTDLFGVTLFNVSGSSIAYFDTGDNRPRLVHVTSYTCN